MVLFLLYIAWPESKSDVLKYAMIIMRLYRYLQIFGTIAYSSSSRQGLSIFQTKFGLYSKVIILWTTLKK